MFKFFSNKRLTRKSQNNLLASAVSLFCLLPLASVISSGETTSKKSSSSKNKFGEKNADVLLQTVENLENFLMEVKGFYTKANGAVKKIERLKHLVNLKQRIYNGSTFSEVMIYLFGFKWLWGIFTGYRSSYIGPAYAELMAAQEALQSNQDFVGGLKNQLFDRAGKAKNSVNRIFGLEGRSVALNLALQKIRTKLNLLDTEYTYLVERLADEERNQLAFEAALASGRKSEYHDQTYRTNIDTNSGGNGVSGNYSSEFTSGLDQGTRQIWEKAEADRYQERRQDLKNETQNARNTFEDTKAIETLIDTLQEEMVK